MCAHWVVVRVMVTIMRTQWQLWSAPFVSAIHAMSTQRLQLCDSVSVLWVWLLGLSEADGRPVPWWLRLQPRRYQVGFGGLAVFERPVRQCLCVIRCDIE